MGLLVLLLLLKGILFHWVLEKQIRRFNERGNYSLSVTEANLHGISRVNFQGITLIKSDGDTLIQIATLDASIRPTKLLTRSRLVKNIAVAHGQLSYVRDISQKDSATKDTSQSVPTENLPLSVYRLFKRYFPSSFSFDDFTVHYYDALGSAHLKLDQISGNSDSLSGQVILSDDSLDQTWSLHGKLDDAIDITAVREEEGPLPILFSRFGADLRSDTLSFSIQNDASNKEQLDLNVQGKISRLRVHHAKLSQDTIRFGTLSANLAVTVKDAFLEVDSNSSFQINQVAGSFGLHMPLTKKGKHYALKIRSNEQEAQDFFDALPKGAFDDLKGIKVAGKLRYLLDFELDGNRPDDVIFDSRFEKQGFKILSYGESNLSIMREDFTHTVYENDRPSRSFVVGPENGYFTPIGEVPTQLIDAILVSEDPSFFHH
ncbi:MAG: hypothetical protein LPK45_02735, partial [Bacteroidota bacterium]|nr:hypothetical protein [Bacteroidota bacterium]MDX5429956.1 hypothetical protein [Bacteroidota bacterium]MDX5468729.1 hypothetical protein [Bacteroidota bacterium]